MTPAHAAVARIETLGTSMVKIERSVEGGEVRLVLSGRIDAEGLAELEHAVARETGASPGITLDLAEVRLLGREAVRYLVRCEAAGMRLANPPEYVREWMVRERNGGH